MKRIRVRLIIFVLILLGVVLSGKTISFAKENSTVIAANQVRRSGLAPFIGRELSEFHASDIFYKSNHKGAAQYQSSWDVYGTRYYYNQMSDNEKRLYDSLDAMCLSYLTGKKDMLYDKEYNIYHTQMVTCTGLTSEEAVNVVYIFYYSNPQYYFLKGGYYYYKSTTLYMSIQVYDDFANGIVRSAATSEFNNKIAQWQSQIDTLDSDVQKEKKIHDLIVDSVIYESSSYDQSAYSVLITGKSVCAGYAMTFQLMCNLVGIDCIMVTSVAPTPYPYDVGHAWNKVRMNDSWYEVDCTWDDYDDYDSWVYDFFNRSCDKMQELDPNRYHVEEALWAEYDAPCTLDSDAGNRSIGTVVTPTETVAAPVIETVINDNSTIVKLSSNLPDTRIFYTLDGSDPSEAYSKSYRYSEEIVVTSNQIIKAIAVATSKYDSTVSSFAVSVYYFNAYKPIIVAQPSNVSCSYGAKVGAIAVLVNRANMGKVTYQWYVSSSKAYNGTLIKGATSYSYAPPSTNAGTRYYYCKITNTDNNAYYMKTSSVNSSISQITTKRVSIKKVKITGVVAKTYTGKAIGQTPKLVFGSMTLKKDIDYTLTYSNNKAVGSAKILIKCKGNYTDQKILTYNINPKGTKFVSKSLGKSQVRLRWNRNTLVNGYQIQYADNSKFSKSKSKGIGSNKTTTSTISRLSSKKYYYIRIRTYKKVAGTTYYSGWSAPVKIKVR